eukprot:9352031-Alexandrium_andersonii.AAC.1
MAVNWPYGIAAEARSLAHVVVDQSQVGQKSLQAPSRSVMIYRWRITQSLRKCVPPCLRATCASFASTTFMCI